MKRRKTESEELAGLRRLAENRLAVEDVTSDAPGAADEPLRLLHELQVYRIELEMQNAELRQARDDTEALLEKYTDLYDFAPVGYVTLDRRGTAIQSMNLTGALLLGAERSRLKGRRFASFVAGENRPAFAAFLEKVYGSRARETCELALLTEGNSPRVAQVEAVAAASGQECRLALIDVTGRRQAEEALRREEEAAEALRREKEAAEEASRAKSLFLATMSHELRTPMTVLLGMLQLALDEEISPTTRDYVETSLGSARALLRIINDILDMARIQAGKLAIVEEPFSLALCAERAAAIMAAEAQHKGIDLDVSVAEGVPSLVVGDQGRLQQVLINLIGNAVKFTDKGRVTIRVSAEGMTPGGKRACVVSVTDTGIGIPADKKGALFRAFSQVDNSDTRRYGGTGLGLAISRELAELMGGAIFFESEEGAGSTFTVTIPLAEAEPEQSAPAADKARPADAAAAAPAGERPLRILVAEDDPDTRKVFGLMLRRSNFRVDYAGDGLQVVAMWKSGGYDILLMDVQMPRLDGYAATRAIREKERQRGNHTPIVAMTAHAGREAEEKCLAAGMDAYISKPIDFRKSIALITELATQHPSHT